MSNIVASGGCGAYTEEVRPESRWTWLTVGLIALVTLGSRLDWGSYPRFLDSYYHLGVIQGFRQAGGVALHAFWEAAPAGRPHLYPPLFHLLWVPVWALTGDPITVARLWTFLGAPLLLLTLASAARALGGPRRAALTVVAALIPVNLYLSTLIHPTATLAAIGVLGVWWLLEQRRTLAAGLLLGLIGYLHPGLPWVTALALGLLGVVDRTRRHALAIAALGLLVMAPWWWHVGQHLAALRATQPPEGRLLELPVVALLLGAVGALIAWRRAPAYRFPLALLAAALPWAARYPYRLLAQGMVPLALLGGVAIESVWAALSRRWSWGRAAGLAGLAALVTLSPSLLLHAPPGQRLAWGDTGLAAARGVPQHRGHAESLYHAREFAPFVEGLRARARPDDLLFCNYPYVNGLLSVLTGLATTTNMVPEARGQSWEAAVGQAQWIVWIKIPAELDPTSDATRHQLATARNWHLITETPIGFLYEAPGVTSRRIMNGRVIPWWVAYAALAALTLAILFTARPRA